MTTISTSVYEEQGFLTPIPVLDDTEAAQMRETFDAIEAQTDEADRSIGLLGLHLKHESVWSLATHPNVVDAVKQAIGPDVMLLGTHFFVKYPSQKDAFVAWHQDVTYWGLKPPFAITAWIAIDDADVANGCMRVIPGSHKQGLMEHGKSDRKGNLLSVNQSIDTAQVDESTAADIELKAGQMSLHDGLLIHGSNPNQSDRRRAGLTVRFTRTDVDLVGHAVAKHNWKPVLVAGEDREGKQTFTDAPF